MKRIFFMLTLIGVAFFTSSYAAGVPVQAAAVQAFEAHYQGAKEILWQQAGVLYKATFVWNGQYRTAFYNAEGDLIAETKNLSSTQLPKALQASLTQELKAGWLTELFIVTVDGVDTYYVQLEDADTVVTLRSGNGKKWTLYQRTIK